MTSSTFATWDPSKTGSDVVLSPNKLTATIPSNRVSLSTVGKSAGKWYWEVHIDSVLSTDRPNLGVAQVQSTYEQKLGLSNNSWAFLKINSTTQAKVTNNMSDTSYGGSPVLNGGQTISFALDMDAVGGGTITLYKNGTSLGVMYGGLTGIIFAAVSRNNTTSHVYTANFGASAFTYYTTLGLAALGYNPGLF